LSTEEITFENTFIQGFLEYSNVDTLSVILRMYYILSLLNEDLVPNIEFKKELIKILIEEMSRDDYVLYGSMITLNNRLMSIIESKLLDERTAASFTHERNVFERYLNARLYYLGSILPYIKYDY